MLRVHRRESVSQAYVQYLCDEHTLQKLKTLKPFLSLRQTTKHHTVKSSFLCRHFNSPENKLGFSANSLKLLAYY